MTQAEPAIAKRKRGAKKSPPRFSREQPDVRRAMLIEAATRCLSVGGIGAFTVDRICKEAGVSRGLINHHFEGRDGLLIEVYKSSLYASVNAHIVEARRRAEKSNWPPGIAGRFGAVQLLARNFSRDNLLIWLSLWGQIAVNPRLKAAHRELYDAYRAELARTLRRSPPSGRQVDAPALARNFIALVDGLWLEWCLDEASWPQTAEAAGFEMVEPRLARCGIAEANSAVSRPRACGAPYSRARPRRWRDRSAAAHIRQPSSRRHWPFLAP
jgi:AcrR family transcriptional regulator